MLQKIATNKGYRYYVSRCFVTCTASMNICFEWQYQRGEFTKERYALEFHNMAVGRINGVAAYKGFSSKEMYRCFAGTK